MSGPMTLTQFREVAEPIMNDNYDGVYEQRRNEWKSIYVEKQGLKRSSHVETVLFGFGNAPIIGDGEPLTYDQGGTQYTVNYPYDEIALGFGITERAREDTDWLDMSAIMSRHLGQSLSETEEVLAANVLNYGFNSAYTQAGGTEQPLFSVNQPLAIGGVYSNLLTPAALSMTSLEAMLIQIRSAIDARGKKINLTPESLVVPPSLMFQAEVVLKSILNPDASTASNAINPINSMQSLKKGAQVITRLTSQTAWFVTTDLNAKGDFGLVKFNRRELKRGSQVDFSTDSIQYKASQRYRFSWLDPRGIYGCVGA